MTQANGPAACSSARMRRDVGVGVAGVDDQRQGGAARGLDVDAQALGLQRLGLGAVVVVEAGLADADELRMPRRARRAPRRSPSAPRGRAAGGCRRPRRRPDAPRRSRERRRPGAGGCRSSPCGSRRPRRRARRQRRSRQRSRGSRGGNGCRRGQAGASGFESVRVQAAWARASAAAASICRNVSRITCAGSRLTARAWALRSASAAASRPRAGAWAALAPRRAKSAASAGETGAGAAPAAASAQRGRARVRSRSRVSA